ncbi:MAG: DUF6067 family protein [Planctomycetota bacterium]|nr:DUF6067 family protein [Planctomycetota bacterium]
MPDLPSARSNLSFLSAGIPLLGCLLGLLGGAPNVLAEGASLPPVLRLVEGQQIVAGRYLLSEQGSILVRVRGEGWNPDQFESYPLISLGKGDNQIQVDVAGATVIVAGNKKRLALTGMTDKVDHLVLIRWNEGRVELWQDGQMLEQMEARFGPFEGNLLCPTPTKNQQPYRILAFSIQRSAISDKSIAETMHSLELSNEPLVTVPRFDLPPQIDGMITNDEWGSAAAISGLHRHQQRLLAGTQGEFLLGYDTEFMYFAYTGLVPAAFNNSPEIRNSLPPLWQNEERHDADIDQDDSIEISVVPDYPLGNRFGLHANHLGRHLDYQAAPSINLSWNPKWETAAKFENSTWTMEGRIPFKAFGVSAAEGDVWGMNFRRVWRMLQSGADEWATGDLLSSGHLLKTNRQGGSTSLGQVRFGGKESVTVRIEEVRGFHTEQLKLSTRLLNPSDKEQRVRLRISSNCGTINESTEVSIPSGGEMPYQYEGKKLPEHSYRLSLQVEELNSGALLHRSVFYHQPQPPARCEIRYYPSFDTVRLRWDFSDLEDTTRLADIAAEVHFIDRKTNKISFSFGIPKFESFHQRDEIDIGRLTAGYYVVAAIVGVNRKKSGQTVSLITKTSGQKWAGNKLGREEYVPFPYQPVRSKGFGAVSGRQVEVIGRVYDFGRAALPQQILINDKPILAGPIRLMAERTDDGKVRDLSTDLVWGIGAGNPIEFDYFARRSDRVVWNSASARSDIIYPTINGWAEYDGLMWFKIAVRGRRWTELNYLKLQIPLKKEWSTLVNSYGDIVGKLPKQGINKHWQPIWLGNEKGGLQWLTESTASWRLERPDRAITVKPRLEDTLLEITFIDHPVRLPHGLTAEFGLIATPVRPPKDWHFTGRSPLGDVWAIGNYVPASDIANPMAWPDGSYGRQVKNAGTHEEERVELAPRVTLDLCRAENSVSGRKMKPTLHHYFHEWSATSQQPYIPGAKSLNIATSSQSWQDFLVWNYSEMYDRSPYSGLYMEGADPGFSDNPDAGAGQLLDKVVYPKWNLLGTRSLLKRVFEMLRMKEPYGSVRLKVDGPMLAPLVGFCEMVSAGDSLNRHFSQKEPHAYQHLTLDQFRAQFLGTNFGPYCWWRPPNGLAFKGELKDGQRPHDLYDDVDRESRWLAGIALVHHCPIWPDLLPGDWSGIQKAVEAYGLDQANWTFNGYWDNPPATLPPDQENLVVSAYVMEDRDAALSTHRVLFVIFNNSDWEGEVKLTPAWEAINLAPGNTQFEDASNGKSLAATATVTINVKARDVALVGLRESKQ